MADFETYTRSDGTKARRYPKEVRTAALELWMACRKYRLLASSATNPICISIRDGQVVVKPKEVPQGTQSLDVIRLLELPLPSQGVSIRLPEDALPTIPYDAPPKEVASEAPAAGPAESAVPEEPPTVPASDQEVNSVSFFGRIAAMEMADAGAAPEPCPELDGMPPSQASLKTEDDECSIVSVRVVKSEASSSPVATPCRTNAGSSKRSSQAIDASPDSALKASPPAKKAHSDPRMAQGSFDDAQSQSIFSQDETQEKAEDKTQLVVQQKAVDKTIVVQQKAVDKSQLVAEESTEDKSQLVIEDPYGQDFDFPEADSQLWGDDYIQDYLQTDAA